jgi:hypothetical protein
MLMIMLIDVVLLSAHGLESSSWSTATSSYLEIASEYGALYAGAQNLPVATYFKQ